jgi:hypothetical protein
MGRISLVFRRYETGGIQTGSRGGIKPEILYRQMAGEPA